MSQIGKVIMGNLTIDDYRELSNAFEKHLRLLQSQLDELK